MFLGNVSWKPLKCESTLAHRSSALFSLRITSDGDRLNDRQRRRWRVFAESRVAKESQIISSRFGDRQIPGYLWLHFAAAVASFEAEAAASERFFKAHKVLRWQKRGYPRLRFRGNQTSDSDVPLGNKMPDFPEPGQSLYLFSSLKWWWQNKWIPRDVPKS